MHILQFKLQYLLILLALKIYNQKLKSSFDALYLLHRVEDALHPDTFQDSRELKHVWFFAFIFLFFFGVSLTASEKLSQQTFLKQ